MRIKTKAERGDRDHHRVTGTDLAELLRPGRGRDQDGGYQLVGGQRVLLDAGEEVRGGDRAGAPDRGDLDLGARGQQRRVAVARWRRGAEVAADRAAVADLRRADR